MNSNAMRNWLAALALVMTVVLAPLALAHHSVAAEYGNGERVYIEGVITDLFWHEPHARIRIETTGGAVNSGEEWDVTTHSPGILARNYDFPPNMVKVGDEVRIYGRVSQFGLPRFALHSISVNGSDEYVLSPTPR